MPISPEMLDLLDKGSSTFTTLIRVTAKPSKGGEVIAYTLHTRDITYDSTLFKVMPFEPSKMQQNAGTQADNATVDHVLGDLYSKLKIRGGKWAGATIEMGVVDPLHLSAGPARWVVGRIGDVTTAGPGAQTAFRGLMHLLNQEIGDRTSRRCRYKLGSSECGVNLASFTFAGTIVTVHNNQKLTVTVSKPDGYFKNGRIVFSSGENDGLEMDLINNDGQDIQLYVPMPGAVSIGDAVNLIAGDDKSLSVCHSKFGNAINFGGEDAIPTREAVYRFPD